MGVLQEDRKHKRIHWRHRSHPRLTLNKLRHAFDPRLCTEWGMVEVREAFDETASAAYQREGRWRGSEPHRGRGGDPPRPPVDASRGRPGYGAGRLCPACCQPLAACLRRLLAPEGVSGSGKRLRAKHIGGEAPPHQTRTGMHRSPRVSAILTLSMRHAPSPAVPVAQMIDSEEFSRPDMALACELLFSVC